MEPPKKNFRPALFEDHSRRNQQRITRNVRSGSGTVNASLENDNQNHSVLVESLNASVHSLGDTNNYDDYELLTIHELSMWHSTEEDSDVNDENEEIDPENEFNYYHENEAWSRSDDNEGDSTEAESEREEENNDSEIRAEDPLLYDGARLTVAESLLAILTVFLRHCLTAACLIDILELIELHCPTPNHCKKSLYLFKQYFKNIYTPLRRHFYCNNCFSSLENVDTLCKKCGRDTISLYFLEIPMINQLQTLYKRSGFFHQLQSRFHRNKEDENGYEDIYDGRIYQERCQPDGLLSNPNNISLKWSSDGISIFHSSNLQIWPFYLSINELPYNQRTKKENLLLGGLWFGPKKPCPPLFLKKISQDLEQLENGVDLEVADLKRSIQVRAEVICGTCDLPAKALFLHMKQFNGEYGCSKCKARSEQYETTSVRIYPFKKNLNARTQEETDRFAAEAVRSGKPIFGVKGPSAISSFSPDYIRTTAVDSMHCVFLGVVKALLILWFSPKFRNNPWSLSNLVKFVNKSLCSIKPPSFVARLPRSVSDHLHYLKASELKIWFFYYSLPILKSIMKGVYLEHYQLLVNGIYLLSRGSISEEMIDLADQFITEFVSRFADLYDDRYMTANIHQLRHLSETVRDFGPLWVTSCVAFENVSGELKNLVTGTRFSGLQICDGVSYFMALPGLLEKLDFDSPVYHFCDRLRNPQRKFKSHMISSNFCIVGTIKKKEELPDGIGDILELFDIEGTSFGIFQRIMKSHVLYTSESYLRCTKTNSTCVKYEFDNEIQYGVIKFFLRVSNCRCKNFCNIECNAKYYAVLKNCLTVPRFNSVPNSDLSGIYECTLTDDIIVVNIDNLLGICFYVKIPNEQPYIIEPPNMYEIE